jgi:hypothetical protein
VNKIDPLLINLINDPTLQNEIRSSDSYQQNDVTINLNTPPKGNQIRTRVTTEFEFFN